MATAPNRTIGKLLISMCTSKIVPVMEYCLKFDGCSKGNPGKAGSGAVIYKNKNEVWGKSLFIGNKNTNNEAEYIGLIIGLEEAINMGITKLYVEGDSLLVIKQMKGEYKVKSENLYKLYEKAKKLEKQINTVVYSHVYRDKNKRADELSNIALNI
jgi:probable phosphoglycerate mutase